MDNKLRIKRVKEGIKMLEKGIDPSLEDWVGDKEKYGVTELGADILFLNGFSHQRGKMRENGFRHGVLLNKVIMLHNWKRFLELIEKL